jgi:hypothetical protein
MRASLSIMNSEVYRGEELLDIFKLENGPFRLTGSPYGHSLLK